MPSFYPRQNSPNPLRASYTPTEFVPSYRTGCGGMPYQQTSYLGQPGIRQQDDGCDFSDRYGQLATAMPPMYPQSGTYLSNAPRGFGRPYSVYEPPIQEPLPPNCMPYGTMGGSAFIKQSYAQEFNQRVNQAPKEEKPVGGVSAKLDYDMDVMTDFVCDTALRIINPGRVMPPPSFRKWVYSVLCATRLPSATILLSMFYLSSRMPMLSGQLRADNDLYRLLTIALVLGSKFLDDNTFINRSWAEVSGIKVSDLNRMETDWLVAINFRLHRDPNEQHGFNSWLDHWRDYQAHTAARANRGNKLSPIDTSMFRRSINMDQNKPLPPLPTQGLPSLSKTPLGSQMGQGYHLPSLAPPPYEYTPNSAHPSNAGSANYSHYDHWRSSNEYSPASAPTTGPTTPEHTGPLGPWPPAEGYSRRTMFGYPPQSQSAFSQPQQQQQSMYGPPAYSGAYNPPAWSPPWGVHDYNCGCVVCFQRHSMVSLPAQAVAG